MKTAKRLILSSLFAVTALLCACATNETAPEENASPEEETPQTEAIASAPQEAPAPEPTPAPMLSQEENAEQESAAAKAEEPVYKYNHPIRNLILTSNYEIPALLAETAREENDVPYLLIPANLPCPASDTAIRFGGGKAKNDFTIPAEHLSKFIAYLRPQNVIILGNREYVSDIYRSAVPGRINVIEMDDTDWKINALKLRDQLRSPEVYKAYIDRRKEQIRKKREEAKAAAEETAAAK